MKYRSNMSPIQLCSLNRSYFRAILWNCILNDRSIIKPKRPMVLYCILKDRSSISPIRKFSSNLTYLRQSIVLYIE